MKARTLAVFFAALCVTLSVITYHFWSKQAMISAHTLKFPLVLAPPVPDEAPSILPAGTTLYYVQSYPEGFSRYMFHIDVKGPQLTHEQLADPTTVRPLTAFAIDKWELKRLLDSGSVTRSGMKRILDSGVLSKDDIRELLAQYSN